MKDNSLKGKLLASVSIFFVYLVAIISIIMHGVTGYYLYHFLAMTSLFLGSTNLLFLLLKYIKFCQAILSEKPKKEKKIKKKKKLSKKRKQEDTEEEDIAEDVEEPKELEEADSEEEVLKDDIKKTKKFNWTILISGLCFAVFILTYYNVIKNVASYVKTIKATGVPALANAVLLLILFVLMLVLDRLCKFSKGNSPFWDALLENSRIFFQGLSFLSLLGVACVIIEWLKLISIQKYVGYFYMIVFFYFVAFVTISLLIITIRKDFTVAPYVNVPIPFYKAKGNRENFIDYLEKNTGISMRSLWSVKYIRQIGPVVVLISAFFLWLSTCVVQVESYQNAVVYRLGHLQEEFLEPGLHFVFPYPFDKVEVYDTGVIQKTTIGYRSEESGDNIWTSAHDGEEYKLLLGSGDELVSINLRLEYQIKDLKEYLTKATAPEEVMKALAYELVTDETISTDLDALLSTDRKEFATTLKTQLTEQIDSMGIGLKIVNVVLESIHPPVEIASVYQELISAEITYDKNLLYAQGGAVKRIYSAEKTSNSLIQKAEAEKAKKVAEAKASVTEFLASAEAYKKDKSSFRYYKYLAAVREAYGKANLVILGEGIDQSALFFGNVVGGTGNSNNSNSNATQ